MNGRGIAGLLALALLAGCGGVDREGGKALAGAGLTATAALRDQAGQAVGQLENLEKFQVVTSILNCSAQTDPALKASCVKGARKAEISENADYIALGKVMAERRKAAARLYEAYEAFDGLVAYNAAAETAAALDQLSDSVAGAAAAAAVLAGPAAPAIPAMSATFGKVLKGIGALVAEERQAALVRAAATDIGTAARALAAVVTIERNRLASASLLGQLEAASDRLYAAYVTAGLVSPAAALAPTLTAIRPGVQVAAPPKENLPAVNEAARTAMRFDGDLKRRRIAAAYNSAVLALGKLGDQHAKFAEGQEISLGGIIAEAKALQAAVDAADKNNP